MDTSWINNEFLNFLDLGVASIRPTANLPIEVL